MISHAFAVWAAIFVGFMGMTFSCVLVAIFGLKRWERDGQAFLKCLAVFAALFYVGWLYGWGKFSADMLAPAAVALLPLAWTIYAGWRRGGLSRRTLVRVSTILLGAMFAYLFCLTVAHPTPAMLLVAVSLGGWVGAFLVFGIYRGWISQRSP